ncbi:hypothetical protein [Pseudomonas rhodesiae]|uniref:Ead/Ea22-like family protein n=1 Tax=Pseudomonas rhodesiae TaxID=76760 RepID=A0AAE8HAA8_9PSED|nr:hypothetical protein [Pseudomonas rhodesiae]SDU97713.1 hypothetical protein SAMN04490209_1399 [Pseudomonas rhodesiae]
MSDYKDLQKAAEYAAQETIKFADENEEMRALQQFHEEVDPETILALIAENQALKGPHDWLAEDLIKELVDNAQAIQENADDGEDDPFVIVLLASASRIRRQEVNIDQLRAEVAGLRTGYEAYERVNAELKAENEALRGVMSAVVSEIPGARISRAGNAPGHCHSIPGVWDEDNGSKAGKECAWCKVWNYAVSMGKGDRP